MSAARFVEALLTGEAGLTISAEGPTFRVARGSHLTWFSMRGFRIGGDGALFVGRTKSEALVVSSYEKVHVEGSVKLSRSETLEVSPSVECLVFWDQSSLLACAGNTSPFALSEVVRVPLRGKPLATSLFADLDEFNQETCQWERLDRRKLLDRLELRVDLGPGSWRVFRAVQDLAQPDRQRIDRASGITS